MFSVKFGARIEYIQFTAITNMSLNIWQYFSKGFEENKEETHQQHSE
jgi:hypothetical protein